MKNKALLWINAILFYDITSVLKPKTKKDEILEWLNSRKPLSARIKDYNKKS
jgi:hypothetical protein|tara:strand:+ start:779 stop:934 length:156 start_codon:yes stop_codon:yes gene_type:complete